MHMQSSIVHTQAVYFVCCDGLLTYCVFVEYVMFAG